MQKAWNNFIVGWKEAQWISRFCLYLLPLMLLVTGLAYSIEDRLGSPQKILRVLLALAAGLVSLYLAKIQPLKIEGPKQRKLSNIYYKRSATVLNIAVPFGVLLIILGPQLSNELPSFVFTLLGHWILLSLGIGSIIMTLILHSGRKDISNKMFLASSTLSLSVAGFLAWHTIHIAKAPNLTCQIEKVVVGEGADTGLTQVFILLSLRDIGAPSSATNYKLHIKTGNFESYVEATDIPNNYTLILADKTDNIKFQKEDSLVQKTTKRIESGEVESGWLRFSMPIKEVTPEFIRRPGIRYTVSLVDAWGKEGKPCSADYVMPGSIQ